MNTTIALLSLLFLTSLSNTQERFELEYEWTYINYTWPSEDDYNDAITAQTYIPENNAMTGIKYYKDKIFIAIPRIRPGIPVTLGYMSTDSPRTNPLVTPYPSWEMNQNGSCDNLQSVQSMEIDSEGVMWVIDGVNTKEWTTCPPKLVLFDLNNNNTVLQKFVFDDYLCLSQGGFLNDLVVDESDGGFAYITEHSTVDPGLIIYSRKENRAWKIRHPSMFSEPDAASFEVANYTANPFGPVDGIALSPKNDSGPRDVYYCATAGYSIFSISTDILKSEEACSKGDWRPQVHKIGKKAAQSDGMMVDNEGNLYYGLLPLYGVGRWNINEPFSEAEVVDVNNETMQPH